VLIGAGAIVVIVLVIFMMKGTGDQAPANTPKVAQPAAQPQAAPAPSVSMAPKKLGKKPTRPAPELSQATLQELDQLLLKITELHNAGTTARLAGDNATARTKEGEAKQLLEQWKDKIDAQLRWQEEAQMEDWEQPAEYVTLERIYGRYQTLTKRVRMGGG